MSSRQPWRLVTMMMAAVIFVFVSRETASARSAPCRPLAPDKEEAVRAKFAQWIEQHPEASETISRRRARLEDHLTKCKPFSTRREGGDDGSGEKLTTREEEDPAEFWGELLFFDHDRGAALDAASSGPVVSKSGGGDRGVEGNGDGDGFKGGVGNGNGDVEAEGSREGKSGKGDGSATAATATFDAAFTSAAEKEAKAEEDLFDEDTVEEVIDMDAHPGFVKPAFDVDDCEPDCDDSEDGLNKKSGTA